MRVWVCEMTDGSAGENDVDGRADNTKRERERQRERERKTEAESLGIQPRVG